MGFLSNLKFIPNILIGGGRVLARRIADEVKRSAGGLVLWWLGNAGFVIRYNEILIFIDPVIELKREDDPTISETGLRLLHELPLRAEELELADIVLLTHHHGDHAAPKTLSLLKETGAFFICPESCLQVLDQVGVNWKRIKKVVYGQKIEYKGVSIAPIRALHGGNHGAVGSKLELGAGYVVRTGRHSVFHPGDTVLLEEHYELRDIEILLLPICHHSQMLLKLPEILAPRLIIPMHYDTYEVTESNRFWTYGNPEDVRLKIGYPERLLILNQGETFRAC